jgi:hypothetical protein
MIILTVAATGGSDGLRDKGLLESEELCPGVIEKATWWAIQRLAYINPKQIFSPSKQPLLLFSCP